MEMQALQQLPIEQLHGLLDINLEWNQINSTLKKEKRKINSGFTEKHESNKKLIKYAGTMFAEAIFEKSVTKEIIRECNANTKTRIG